MTDPTITPSGDDADDLLAAELAFGLLDAPDRAAAEMRTAVDAAFARRHRWWQARAFALLGSRDEAPPARVWSAIARRLPANDSAPDARPWKLATALATCAALAFGATTLLRPAPPPATIVVQAPRPLVAVLAAADRADLVAVDYDPATRRLSVRPTALAPGDRAAELWVIPAGGTPVSLGVVAAQGRTRRIPADKVAALLVPGSTLAISLEPQGGSPTGAPTGAVILTGRIARG